ncbi:hypothetical protein D3C83_212380 [compost metagenome]
MHLAVDQPEVALFQLVHEVRHRHLRGIGLMTEHRLAEKDAAQRDTIESADQRSVCVPALDRDT